MYFNRASLITWDCTSEINWLKRLSLVVSFMASFVLSFFPLDVLDEIWDLTESVSEGFLTYFMLIFLQHNVIRLIGLASGL